jgi:RNA polymerase sigma factor (sigma-70 family)
MDDPVLIDGFLAGRRESHRQVDAWIGEVLRRFPLGPDREDVAQDVRRKLFESLRRGRFDGRASLRTYVWKAAQCAAIDHARTRRRRPTPLTLEDAPDPPAPPGEDPLEAQERRAAFDRVMASLSEGCQALWAMIVFEELGYPEIAGRLGISAGAVKVRALRCRAEASRRWRGQVTEGRAERPFETRPGELRGR